MDELCGIINIYKESGCTSHSAAAAVKKVVRTKTGHTGTLDPNAEGVLPVCVGRATKLFEKYSSMGKTYRAEIILGVTTDTADITGNIIKNDSADGISVTEVQKAASNFIGGYMQMPPMYSALKINGKKLYEIARSGKIAEREPRFVQIDKINVFPHEKSGRYWLEVFCGKGTYIRTLCEDIGNRLGCGACMGSLLRTEAGGFYSKDGIKLDVLQKTHENDLWKLCGSVLTIGKFECMHKGHRTLIKTVADIAKEECLTAAVITFDPHPYKFFKNKNYQMLYTKNEIMRQFFEAEIKVETINFDEAFAAKEPEEFCRRIFYEYNCRVLVVGEHFKFGKDRKGDVNFLIEYAKKAKRKIVTVPSVLTRGGAAVCSSLIRNILTETYKDGALQEAEAMLGSPFFILGTVEHGKKIGKLIGYPTINIVPPSDKFLPVYGVYATLTSIFGKKYKSITNVGIKPTVANDGQPSTETNIFGFDGDLYGCEIKIEFLLFIRHERRFESLHELSGQMQKDITTAEIFFKGYFNEN
ncbi:MAG: riboflavin biosynthesis protein RibF [Defluviitaleaceae bacterium]|nr:riboflavin biosynthesis protein RibF [Defluviitaleaceae bacterium]